jgi:hypothetical protein
MNLGFSLTTNNPVLRGGEGKMIDPITLLQTQRSITTSDSTDRTNKDKTASTLQTLLPSVKSQGVQDSVALNFNIHGDLEELKNSVATVFDQVKQQLEKYYSLDKNQDGVDESEYVPPENASAQDLLDYVSPENTAKRILGFTTGFFSAYQSNHKDASAEDNVNGFTTLIGDAIKKGFKDAENILGSYDELGQIGDNIKKTYDLVMKGLEDFRLKNLNDLGLMPGEPEDPLEESAQTSTEINTELDVTG